MEDKRKIYINDMYKYTRRGSTLYDFLGNYLGQSDFSPAAIFNTLRRDLNIQQDIVQAENANQFDGLVKLYRESIQGRIVDSMLDNISAKEKEELLKKLQSVNPKLYSFPGILQYIAFLEDSNFTHRSLVTTDGEDNEPVLDKDIDELNRILIDTAVEKADQDLVFTVRNSLVRGMLIPYVRRKINREADGPEKEQNYKKLILAQNIFSNTETLKEYDDAIGYEIAREEEAMEKARREVEFKFKRLSAMASLTGKAMPELLEKCDLQDGSFIDLVSRPEPFPKGKYEPRGGDYHWSFIPLRKPTIVFNEQVEFSKDGEENQEVVVARYGDFVYGKSVGVSAFDDLPIELVGITVLGNDVNNNYFLFTPTENIRNMQNKVNSEYYKKVLLSPWVLDDIVGYKSRFLPCMSIDEDGMVSLDYDKEISMLDLNPQEALKYATMFEGSLGREHAPMTIQDFCNSQELFKKQMELLYRAKMQERDSNRGEY